MSGKNALLAASLLALSGFAGVMEISAVHAAEINAATVKTMHLKLRHNAVWTGAEGIFEKNGCASLPPLPEGTHPLIDDSGKWSSVLDTEIDIYWTRIGMAVYEKGARYNFGPGCRWNKSTVDTAKINDFKSGSFYLLDFGKKLAHKTRSKYPASPESQAAQKLESESHQKNVLRQDVVAGRQCDVKILPSGEYAHCVLSSLHYFPVTGDIVALWTEQKKVPAGDAPWIFRKRATLIEVDVPIPEERLKIPHDFQITDFPTGLFKKTK